MLTALSPLDGRYAKHCEPLTAIASEFGLNRYRCMVELEWLIALSQHPQIPEVPALSPKALAYCKALMDNFSVTDAERIKAIEAVTNHDVKALEYWIKEQCQDEPELQKITEFVHFACTSEDINNLAYALMSRDLRDQVLLPDQHNSRLNYATSRTNIATYPCCHTPMVKRPRPRLSVKNLPMSSRD